MRHALAPALALLVAGLCAAPNGSAAPSGSRAAAPPVVVTHEAGALDGSIAVSPTRIQLYPASPGQVVSYTVTVRNRRTVPTRFAFVPIGMAPARDAGRTVRFLEPGDPDAPATAIGWLHPAVPAVDLAPGDMATVQVRVVVPRVVSGGGHYAALAVRPTGVPGAAAGPDVGVQPEVAIALLAVSPGGVDRSFALRSMSADRLAFAHRPYRIRLHLENRGNVHERFTGSIRVNGMFGTVATLPVRSALVLPGGRTTVEVTWRGVPLVGVLHLHASVAPEAFSDANTAPTPAPGSNAVPGAHAAPGPVGAAATPAATATTRLEPARAARWIVALPPPWVLAVLAVLALFAVVWRTLRREEEDDDEDDAHFDDDHGLTDIEGDELATDDAYDEAVLEDYDDDVQAGDEHADSPDDDRFER